MLYSTGVSDEKGRARWVQLRANAADAGRPEDRAGVIVVGKISTYRHIDDRSLDDEYEVYVREARISGRTDNAPKSRSEFAERFVGWTFAWIPSPVPLMDDVAAKVLIPAELRKELDFAYAYESLLFRGRADLVAATTNEDGALVVVRRLCARGDDYERCAEDYVRGYFDATTGAEIDYLSFRPRRRGARIDTETFRAVDSAASDGERAHRRRAGTTVPNQQGPARAAASSPQSRMHHFPSSAR